MYLAFFKSYFQEKGKNIATSEDIENLTTKVESVKQKFLDKNTNLKAKLDLLTNLQIGHRNDEKSALLSFHQCISAWIVLLTRTSILVDEYDNDEIMQKIYDYEEHYKKVNYSHALLKLYVEDEKLLALIDNIIIKTLENLSSLPTKHLRELKI